jgi:hypothetical protein
MRRMDSRTVAAVGTLAGLLALASCGGGAKSPGTCPAGTVLKGSDCVPDDASGDDSTSSSSGAAASGSSGASGGGSSGGDDSSTGSSGGAAASSSGGGSGDTGAATGKTPYDKEAVDVQLKRAARQVKGHCGSATDENGAATGPFGQTKASLVLGRNGHVKQVTVPAPYDGKPVGICVIHAFQKIVFPPYGASSDSILDWDVEIVQPGK